MKIGYINGFGGEKSNKPQILSKLLQVNVKHIVYDYKKNNLKEIEDSTKDFDVIIASSTGAYLARNIAFKNNFSLVSLNPVMDLEETFGELGAKTPEIPEPENVLLSELVLLNKDDELIDYKKALKTFSNVVVFNKGGHRFNNLEETIPYINDFIKFLHIK